MTTSCPLCHTPSPTLTDAEMTTGGAWQCGRCGHHWDVVRLATVAAYAAFEGSRPVPAVRWLPDVHN
jgi:transposase